MKKVMLGLMLLVSVTIKAQRPIYIDKELKPYVLDYLMDLLDNDISITEFYLVDTIHTVPITQILCGDTIYNGCAEENLVTKGKRIHIQQYQPNFKVPVTKDEYYRYLIYHELGHALFGLSHKNDGKSIMNDNSEDNCYATLNWNSARKKYLKKLKKLLNE